MEHFVLVPSHSTIQLRYRHIVAGRLLVSVLSQLESAASGAFRSNTVAIRYIVAGRLLVSVLSQLESAACHRLVSDRW